MEHCKYSYCFPLADTATIIEFVIEVEHFQSPTYIQIYETPPFPAFLNWSRWLLYSTNNMYFETICISRQHTEFIIYEMPVILSCNNTPYNTNLLLDCCLGIGIKQPST